LEGGFIIEICIIFAIITVQLYRSFKLRILIDTSAVIAILLNEELNRSIIELTKGVDVVSASSLPWEVGNALTSNLRKKRINHSEAIEAIQNYQKMGIRLIEVELEDSMNLASNLNIYAYDAYMLCCANTLRIPILSLDYHMIENAKKIGIKTLEVN
jgi:predicted nucleic acid-binding protein